jgi:PAS domain S-box-containing protein
MSEQQQPSDARQIENLIETPDLATALESERFKKFLDQVPIAICVADLRQAERVVYANPEFERVSGLAAASLSGRSWDSLDGEGLGKDKERPIAQAVVEDSDCVGTFKIPRPQGQAAIVDVYSNVIVDDDGHACFRLVALVDVTTHQPVDRQAMEDRIREKDVLLKELQHRVKNNLQMVTALIRLETRNDGAPDRKSLERLAGRVESLAILYRILAGDEQKEELDLGVYLSQLASAAMAAHAAEGIRLDLKLDAYPVSINVAMPTGLVVNELLTNAFKHAFVGRDSGTIRLLSVVEGDGCKVVVADDGVGLPDGQSWPKPGKLGALIAQSLVENARARFEVESSPQTGTKVTISFSRALAVSG